MHRHQWGLLTSPLARAALGADRSAAVLCCQLPLGYAPPWAKLQQLPRLPGRCRPGCRVGVVTKAILKAQAARLGRLTSSQVGAQQAKYRLMRQVKLIKSAGVTIETPRSHTVKNDPYTEMLSRKARPEEDPLDCLDIASLMSHIRLDPKLIGETKKLCLSAYFT